MTSSGDMNLPPDPSFPFEPDMSLDLIVDWNLSTEKVDTRSAVILEAAYDCLVLSQTTPPFGSGMTGRDVEVTFLDPDAQETPGVRLGFMARVLDVRQAGPDRPGSVTISAPAGEIYRVSLRQFRRLDVLDKRYIAFRIDGLECEPELIDLSIGGAQVAVPDDCVPPGDRPLSFTMSGKNGETVSGRATVISISRHKHQPRVTIRMQFEWPADGEKLAFEGMIDQLLGLDKKAKAGF